MALPIPVVCAVIEDGSGRVLVAQRPENKHLAMKWEFAGGKVEPDEVPELALIREIYEELGCGVEILRSLPPFVHDYGDIVIEMIPFVCALVPRDAVPCAKEHAAIRWVTIPELRLLDLAPADWPVVDAYAGPK